MKKTYVCLLSALAFSANIVATSVWADDTISNRETIEKLDKDIAKSREKVDNKASEVATRQTKLEKDTEQFGANSDQVKDDHKVLKEMRTELIDLKTDLFKNTAKKKVEEGQPIESDTSC